MPINYQFFVLFCFLTHAHSNKMMFLGFFFFFFFLSFVLVDFLGTIWQFLACISIHNSSIYYFLLIIFVVVSLENGNGKVVVCLVKSINFIYQKCELSMGWFCWLSADELYVVVWLCVSMKCLMSPFLKKMSVLVSYCHECFWLLSFSMYQGLRNNHQNFHFLHTFPYLYY